MSNKIETDQRTRTADAAASGNQAYLIFLGAMVNDVTSFGATTRGQLNRVANSAQVAPTAMTAGPTNR